MMSHGVLFNEKFMNDHMLLWSGHGWDNLGARTHEALSANGTMSGPKPAYRTMALCRQIYMRAVLSTSDPVTCRVQSFILLKRLQDVCWDSAKGEGWYFSVDESGFPADPRKDLYTHAFVILAASVAFRTFCESWILEIARKAVEVTYRLFSLADRSWLASSLDISGVPVDRRLIQNPHMHLFEALMAFALVSRRPEDYDRVGRLVAIFPRLLHPRVQMIAEFFTQDGQPEDGDKALIEPGHQFEWAWLLYSYALYFCHNSAESRTWYTHASDLLRFGLEYGVDREYGGVFNVIDASGRIIDDRKRIWPVTEALKATSVLLPGKVPVFLDLLQAHYLRPGGRWIETCDKFLRPVDWELKATTGYHLATAWQELPPNRQNTGVYASLCAEPLAVP